MVDPGAQPAHVPDCVLVRWNVNVDFFFSSSEILGREGLWNILLCIPALFSVVEVLVLPLLPDSPRYLFIEKGDEKACRKG